MSIEIGRLKFDINSLRGTNNPEQKQKLIGEIVQQDRVAFYSFVCQNRIPFLCHLPPEALRYMLIPERLLELVDDPRKVDLWIKESDSGDSIAARVLYKNSSLSFPFKKNEPDKSLLALGFTNIPSIYGHSLFVDIYQDLEENRGKGVARSFFERLSECAREMGFKAITGTDSTKRGYFVGKGVTTLDQLKIPFRSLFGLYEFASNGSRLIINFLDQKMRDDALKPQAN